MDIWKLRAGDSIEHIFPQNAEAITWRGKMARSPGEPAQAVEPNVNRIGNLILLPLPLNQEARDFAFTRKKEAYAKHNLRMVHEVVKNDDWTLCEIESREALIVSWAKARWCDV